MKYRKLLARFYKESTLLYLKEEQKVHQPYTTKVSIWKNESDTTKVLLEEFFDKFIEANDLYSKDELNEFPNLEAAIQLLKNEYTVELVNFELSVFG